MTPLIKKYTTHPESQCFMAPEVDPEAPDLVFKDKRDMETKFKLVQNVAGGAAHVVSDIMVDTDQAIMDVTKTISELTDPTKTISREEYVEILTEIRGR